ncbi:hypothetical protein DJ90_6548 [Paenibacillus macerans]|uniref:Uncharacterized protein n=1 Tax=Paenibacillus macerans TaxID=44252 RepID=A0A090ZNB0_PAEMA|nr:hypothetical protein DJ90_6548 [Paenibacillus macerans]
MRFPRIGPRRVNPLGLRRIRRCFLITAAASDYTYN